MGDFLIAGGSVPGTNHTKPGQPGWVNNQDAFHWVKTDSFLAAAVCDGCGSVPHSEVGAYIGSRLAVKMLERFLHSGRNISLDMLRFLKWEMMRDLEVIAARVQNTGVLGDALWDAFLFTIVGVVMDQHMAMVFSLGDGVVALNGKITVLGPYENNAPPYIAYNLVKQANSQLFDFQEIFTVPIADVDSILIGTDGAADLVRAEQTMLPMVGVPLGALAQFWEEEKFVTNPDAIRRRLAMANRECVEDNRIQHGLLPDDTTIIVVRRATKTEVRHA